jgi:hypothetical protein
VPLAPPVALRTSAPSATPLPVVPVPEEAAAPASL